MHTKFLSRFLFSDCIVQQLHSFHLMLPVNRTTSLSLVRTIHPDSTANQCVVMAMADGSVTRTGTLLRDNICINDFTKFLANYI